VQPSGHLWASGARGLAVLFDANLLVHAHAADSPLHGVARRLRDQAARGELEACISPQVLCEFFAVCTNERFVRPALTSKQAAAEMATYWQASGFRKILPKDTTVRRLTELVAQHTIGKQQVFDAFLVATMLDNGVRTIYTQNTKDFVRYSELQAINPFTT